MSLTKATYSMIRGAVVNVLDYGAVGDGTTDSTTAIQAALNYAALLTGGGAVYIPQGNYLCSASIQVKANTLVFGDGHNSSVLKFTNTGKGLYSSFTPNTTNVANIKLRDFAITCTNVSNTNGGYVDVCGSFIDLENVYISGFQNNIILDQSELVTILRCELINNIANGSNIWIVNGDDYTTGNLPGFTNNITVRETQLNAISTSYAQIYDQGGSGHWFENNNYNGGANGILAYAANALTIKGGSFESQTDYPIVMDFGVPLSNGTFTPCQGITVTGCGISSLDGSQPVGILVGGVRSGQITDNQFSGFYEAAIEFSTGNRPLNVTVQNNGWIVGTGPNSAIMSADATGFQMNNILQNADTKCTTGGAIVGANLIQPVSMYGIEIGTYLYCVNLGGTNGEIVEVTNTTATTFTATFTSTKSVLFLINGVSAP